MGRMRWILPASLLLGGCAAPVRVPPAPPAPQPAPLAAPAPAKLPHYRCEGGLEFDARFGEGSVELRFASREPELLLRDAGGTTPQQTVYSSTRAKVEFDGRDAKLNFVAPPVEARCRRD